MPDMGIGTIVSAGASILGGALSGQGAKEASQTQAQAGQASIAEQKREFDIGQQNLAPYRNVGQAGLYKLADYLGLSGAGTAPGGASLVAPTREQFMKPAGSVELSSDPSLFMSQLLAGGGAGQVFDQAGYDAAMANYRAALAAQPQQAAPSSVTGSLLKPFSFDISQDPGYQFRLQQGEQAITNRASATGGVSGSGDLSGATLKELLRYGQDYASGEFNQAFQRDQATKAQQYGFLTGVAGMGQGATTTGVQAGQQTAANIGNTIQGIGNAQAAGQVGQANALSGAFGNIGSTVSQAAMLKQIFGNQGVNQVNQGVNLPTAGAGDLPVIS